MKKGLLIFLMLFFVTIGYAQKSVITETKEQIETATDSLTEEEQEMIDFFVEEAMLSIIDSIKNEGRYMQALDMIDSLQANWKRVTGRPLPPRIYLRKGLIQAVLEDWRELIATTDECLFVNKSNMLDSEVVIIYKMQGIANKNLEKYKEAIRSYENAIYYYTELGELGNQGEIFCDMAYCYASLKKYSIASSFYKKGLDKYLNYFDVTRSTLLRGNFYVKDPYKKTDLGLFAAHLYYMAVFEQDYGDKSASKEYLLMSAHCGNEIARSEYLRIYGR